MDSALYLGLISGTSVDGIDAALVHFGAQPELVHAATYPWERSIHLDLVRLGQESAVLTLDQVAEMDTRIGLAFARAAQDLCASASLSLENVKAIGSHGQTLRHRPIGPTPYTMQLGDPNIIAELTGITTVADFRRRDVAAGGNGAPLMPAFHASVLRSEQEERAVLNLGGIANLTLLPRHGHVTGFDTGPANGLMDAWCMRASGAPFDRDGTMASAGHVLPDLLRELLAEPWLSLAPPKSTGRDHFHIEWLRTHLHGDERPNDVQATLLEYSVQTICDALQGAQPDCERLIACGGGVRNPVLMRRLAQRLPDVVVESSSRYGLDPDFVEAMGFAWLARETLAHRPGNLPRVTGARCARILGAVYAGTSQ